MTGHPQESELEAWIDGELPPSEAAPVERHLAECGACAATRDQLLALRTALRGALPPRAAPTSLRRAVEDAAARRNRPTRRFTAIIPLAAAAMLVLAVGGTWQVASRHAAGEAAIDQVLATHVRSLMPSHLTDVISTDQHTVKPWFNGRLDYSPPVNDFAGRGYPLVGGRLDYVMGHAVAALVYMRRQHVINVLLWPADRGTDGSAGPITRQGYHLEHWSTARYSYWVVSDLGTAELEEFTGLLKAADAVQDTGKQ